MIISAMKQALEALENVRMSMAEYPPAYIWSIQ